MDDKDKAPPTATTGNAGKPVDAKPVIRGKGKGKALNVIAAASGRDPAAIVKSVTEAEAAAAAARAQAEEVAKKAAEKQSSAKEEVNAVQILYDSLSQEQLTRFECFRRSGFASKPIEKFVAKMLIDEAEKRYLGRRGAMDGLGLNVNGGVGNVCHDVQSEDSPSKRLDACRKRKSKKHILLEDAKKRRSARDQPLPYFLRGCPDGSDMVGNASTGGLVPTPPLENLVVPSSASEIVAVVATLAKCYGQRLVAAAKRMADAEEEEHDIDGTAPNASSTAQKPLLPRHLLEAHRHRSRAGVDPGFWMADRTDGSKFGSAFKNGGVGTAEAAALGTVDRDKTCYLAALAAQDAFDREVEEEEGEINRHDRDDNMEVEDS